MNIFGTKIGLEDDLSDDVNSTVDKPAVVDESSGIINSNENTTG